MTWYQELGFASNPLDVRPNSMVVGLHQQEEQLKNHIHKGELCFLNGLTGSGKTSLLLKLQQEMKGYKFIYLDAQDLPPGFNLEQEIKKKRNFFDKLRLKKYPSKKPVLVIDEFQDTDQNLVMEARGKWENPGQRKIHGIVFAQISKALKNVTPSFKERLGNRIIRLPTLDEEEMKEILYQRLKHQSGANYADQLHEEAQNLLIDCADGNPRRLLEYADMVFDFHHRKFKKRNPVKVKSDYQISYWGVKEILQLNQVNVEHYEYKHKPKKKKMAERFTRMFTKQQRDILKYLMTGSKTFDDVAGWFNISRSTAEKKLRELKKQNAIVTAGRKDRKRLWQVAPHIKRLSVKV